MRPVGLLVLLIVFSPSLRAQVGPVHGRVFFPPPRNLIFNQPQLLFQGAFHPIFGHRHHFRKHFFGGFHGRHGQHGFQRHRRHRTPFIHFGFSRPGGYSRAASVYGYFLNSPPRGGIHQANSSNVTFQVKPGSALIFIDEKLIGSADDFATEKEAYTLVSGEHTLRIEHPGHVPFETVLEVTPDRTLHLQIELEKSQGRQQR